MATQEKTYQVFIASPGDAKDERDLIESVVEEINRQHQGVSLVSVRWETAPPNLNEADTQAFINQSLQTCDVMVAVFRDRLGTATARAVGGAVEEVRDFDKQVLLYVYEEYEDRILGELRKYIPKLENRTWKTYSELSELKTTLRNNIAFWFNKAIKPVSTVPTVKRPRLFIEEHFPVAELGIESVRERAVAMDLPPLFALHVWWARRPLVASAAAVLGSLLPAWSYELVDTFRGRPELETRDAYSAWFLRLCGIWGDPVAGRRAIDRAKITGERLKGNAYGYKQAYKNHPSAHDIDLLHQLLQTTWQQTPNVLDPTAGGGSIPFEAVRYGLPTHANDLNSVAATVLRAGIELPALYGHRIVPDLEQWGDELIKRLERRLAPYFRRDDPEERVVAYIWARTVACPRTGKTVPLISDLSLRRGDNPVAVRLVTERGGLELEDIEYDLLEGVDVDFDPKAGATLKGGKAKSPWDDQIVDSHYIRSEAQAGRMGEVLYATAVRTGKSRGFRTATKTDLEALAEASSELNRLLPRWEVDDVLPTELIPDGTKTREPHNYGMNRWQDMFSARQLLVHGCFVEEYRKIVEEVRAAYADDRSHADAILALLAMMQGKALNYNSRQSSWTVGRGQIRSSFDRHAFPFRSTFAEFEGSKQLFDWILRRQLLRAVRGIGKLLHGDIDVSLSLDGAFFVAPPMRITQGNAGNLHSVSDGSQTLICMDPPYYDNVMYAELADYFYVWEKRTIGGLWPEFFTDELTKKIEEAVTNKARFADQGRQAKEWADKDYTGKMGAIFRECHRVLADGGVLTVMFTHKRAEAWDALGTALLEADFTIESSWPVRTESEQSLHQARSNSVTSTIFLVCRKRAAERGDGTSRETYLDEIEGDIRRSVHEAYDRSHSQGLDGVDLLLATYGPALSVLSQYWPVYSDIASEDGVPRKLRPEEALKVARGVVVGRIKDRIVQREAVEFDHTTDFVVLAWKLFNAREMPYDEARRLALAIGGLEMDDLDRDKIIAKKGGTVTLCEPQKRLRRDGDEGLSGVNRSRRTFAVMLDAVHTALYIVGEEGPGGAKPWLDERNLTNDQRFLDCIQALVNAVPRSKTKGTWNVAEAGLLDRLVSAYFPSIVVPPDPLEYDQQSIPASGGG